jgi:hypothetical protein
MNSAQGNDLAPICGDLNQSEKLSKIKPPLLNTCLLNTTLHYQAFLNPTVYCSRPDLKLLLVSIKGQLNSE